MNTDVRSGTFRDSELHYQTRASILNLDAPCLEWRGRAAAQTNKQTNWIKFRKKVVNQASQVLCLSEFSSENGETGQNLLVFLRKTENFFETCLWLVGKQQ